MISSRRIEEKDRADIEAALIKDAFHQGTKADAFYKEGTISNIYEDEAGPIFALRASRSLRIDMMFFSNDDHARNKDAMLAGWPKLLEGAKAAGFTEITTSSNSLKLVAFAERILGFERVQTIENGETALRRLL